MDPRIAWAVGHLEQQLGTPVAVPELAAAVNLSPSRFAHLFTRELGVPPGRYLQALRMLRARQLLERTFLTVKEVMHLVGCNDASHFSRDFREAHGFAPRDARRAWRADRAPSPGAAPQGTVTVEDVAAVASRRRRRQRPGPGAARTPRRGPGCE